MYVLKRASLCGCGVMSLTEVLWVVYLGYYGRVDYARQITRTHNAHRGLNNVSNKRISQQESNA